MLQKCSILTLAPYKVLPATTGGHLGIVSMQHNLGKICQVHVAGTTDNEENTKYAFQLHKVFPAKPTRYLPLYGLGKLAGIGKRYDANAIFCEHPYMALTAMALARKLKIPWFLRSHNIESERFRSVGKKWWRILQLYERFAMKKADGIFFITPEEKSWAMKHFELEPVKCHIIPYGSDLEAPPAAIPNAKETIAKQYALNTTVPWIYFLGAMNYLPNENAVKDIVNNVLPLLEKTGKQYEVIIAGKGLSAALQQQIKDTSHVHYLGFVDDLNVLLTACDVMINPVLTGGGIKTKAVEALGYSKIVVSTVSGAQGILPAVCGNNLTITPDGDWERFAAATLQATTQKATIPQVFYETYYWGNIARKVISIIKSNS